MTDAITAIFCTLVAAAGWYYLTQSRTVDSLSAWESPRRNTARRRVRRMGAWSMIVLSISSFWMMWEAKVVVSRMRFGFALLLVCISLITMVVCATADVYLTMRMRRSNGPPL